jgi:hypothetical protein
MSGTVVDLVAATLSVDLDTWAHGALPDDDRPLVTVMAEHVVLALRRPELPPQVASEAQGAVERHLEACWAALDALHELPLDAPVDLVDRTIEHSPACAPFCGCRTCEVRESLWAAWPVFERYYGLTS